jgi:Inner membrane component of T3SS, cytoplasmic domain/Domain of unknown function (DUF1707)
LSARSAHNGLLLAGYADPDNPDVAAGEEAGHEIRVSDAERDDVVDQLGRRFAEGRITHETFVGRVDAALRARVRGELQTLLADLPRHKRRRPGAWLRRAGTGQARRLLRAVDAWTRKEPAPITLPASSQTTYTIGRDEGCDLVLADHTVSRVHARLEQAADGWLLDDLGSTNGTRVNGWRVTLPTPVAAGDCVSFGAATFVLRARHSPVASAP